MTTDYDKTLRDLQERERAIIRKLQELDKRNQILREVNQKLRTRCFSQVYGRASL